MPTALKKVCLVDKNTGTLMRTVRSLAIRLVAAGTHTYTTKSKLKKFINRDRKVAKTFAALKAAGIDLKGDKKGSTIHREEKGKQIIMVKLGDRQTLKGWLDPVYQRRILMFPS